MICKRYTEYGVRWETQHSQMARDLAAQRYPPGRRPKFKCQPGAPGEPPGVQITKCEAGDWLIEFARCYLSTGVSTWQLRNPGITLLS